MPAVSIDYATVTAGQNTPLLGQVLIVDDDDPSITYKGNWSRNANVFLSSYGPYIGLPYGNATHQTTTPSASATFRFSGKFLFEDRKSILTCIDDGTGTGITVAGIFSYDVLGTISVEYTLDGVSSFQNYTVTPTTTEFTSGIKQQENFILFANQWLAAGNRFGGNVAGLGRLGRFNRRRRHSAKNTLLQSIGNSGWHICSLILRFVHQNRQDAGVRAAYHRSP